jgi:hypothetical protein
VTDQGELDYLVRDTIQSGTLVGAPGKCPLGWILTYYDGSQPQYAHLRASMLAYAHINLVSMLADLSPQRLSGLPLTAYISRKRRCISSRSRGIRTALLGDPNDTRL